MFTGIIEELGVVKNIVRGHKSITLSISCKKILDDVHIGDSVAVNGVCLTVTKKNVNIFFVDVTPETMRRTSLRTLAVLDHVHLERALQLSSRLGGHIVSGHVDGIGTVIEKRNEDNALWLTIETSSELLKYIVLKGSICVDGVSLTVAYVDVRCFKVSLIPLTAEVTTLSRKTIGDEVNIECDVIGKYVEKIFNNANTSEGSKKKNIVDVLRENGFT